MKKKIKKLFAGILMVATILGTTCVANAKTYSYIRTTLEIQINSTGQTLAWVSNPVYYVPNKIIEAITTSNNPFDCKLAAFSAHEVVGKKGFVEYCSTTY